MIRPFEPRDLPAVASLGIHLYSLHHAALPNIYAAPSDSSRNVELWRKRFAAERTRAWVAEENSRVIGFVYAAV